MLLLKYLNGEDKMGIFDIKRVPRREVTTTIKTYATEYDKEPQKEKKGLFSIKKEPDKQSEQNPMEINNKNQEENYR
jgi:hypothetical protein